MLIIFLILLVAAECSQMISISLNKNMHLPKGSYSSLQVIHRLDRMDESIFSSTTTLKLQPSHSFSNEKFDIFRDNQSQLSCYISNLNQAQYLYSKNKSCSATCSMNAYRSFVDWYVQQFNGDSNETQINLIIDNTYSPCHNGTYYPQVDIFQEMNTIIKPNMSYFYLYKALILVLIIFVLIAGTVNVIMWVKFQNIRKALNASRTKSKNRDNLDVIYTKIKQQNQVQSQEVEESVREHSNSEIMMRIN